MFRLLEGLRGKIRDFYSVVERYGYGEVPAAEVYALFESISSPDSLGFTRIKPGFYARPVDADIFHVFKLQALKGSAYSVWWGVSLSYLPALRGSRLRYHRTLKAVELDLFEESLEYFEPGRSEAAAKPCFAQNGHGPIYFRKTLEEMWTNLAAPLREWFGSTANLAGVLAKAEEQVARTWLGPYHSPDPRLVQAFTLRRLGRGEEARASLELYLERATVSAAAAELLRQALGVGGRTGGVVEKIERQR